MERLRQMAIRDGAFERRCRGELDFRRLVVLGPRSAEARDDIFTVGDPVVGAMWGWRAGNVHWSVGSLVNVPIGDYQDVELANIAFHRWGADLSGAATWFDPALGTEA